MESLKSLGKNLKGKAEQGVFDMIGDVLGSIDAFDQLGELAKTVVPMKAEIEVKGKKTLEVMANFNSKGEFWVGFRRLGKAEPETDEEPEEA